MDFVAAHWFLWLVLTVVFGGYVALNELQVVKDFLGMRVFKMIFDTAGLMAAFFAGIFTALLFVLATGVHIVNFTKTSFDYVKGKAQTIEMPRVFSDK